MCGHHWKGARVEFLGYVLYCLDPFPYFTPSASAALFLPFVLSLLIFILSPLRLIPRSWQRVPVIRAAPDAPQSCQKRLFMSSFIFPLNTASFGLYSKYEGSVAHLAHKVLFSYSIPASYAMNKFETGLFLQ